MRQCPSTGCVCLMPLVGGLDLLWIQVMSFLRVCWQLSPWWGVWGWRWERLGWIQGKVGLALCSLAITALFGVESDPKLLKQKPGCLGLSWLCSL